MGAQQKGIRSLGLRIAIPGDNDAGEKELGPDLVSLDTLATQPREQYDSEKTHQTSY